jgi:hypothetical protein
MSGMADEPTDALPVSQLLEIDAICARFEAAWKAGEQPKVEDYLGTTRGPQRAELQRELEKIDAEYRLKAKAKAPPSSPTPAKPQAGAAVQPAKPQAFDPYYQWLGIPPKYQPPDHYRLLGLEQFENNSEVIRDAVARQMAHVRTYQLGPQLALSQKILNELGAAKACLSDPKKKAAYDAQLRQNLAQPAKTPIPEAIKRIGNARLEQFVQHLCRAGCSQPPKSPPITKVSRPRNSPRMPKPSPVRW